MRNAENAKAKWIRYLYPHLSQELEMLPFDDPSGFRNTKEDKGSLSKTAGGC